MTSQLFAAIQRASEELNKVEFKVNKEQFEFHYRYLTYFEKQRVINASTKVTKHTAKSGEITTREEVQDELIPIYTILEMARDEEGKKLFSLTSREDYEKISKMEWSLVSHLATVMTYDILSEMENGRED